MRRYRRRTNSQYLLPFVVLLSFGVFLILAFQLWGSFFPAAKGDAVFYLAEGRSKVLSFGTTEWENVYNGSKVKLGDSVKTLGNAKGVMTFYDGTVMRMDEDTQVTLVDINKKNDYQEILIYLNSGKVWVNKPKQNVIRKTDFVINTNFASYAITGTIFDLEKAAEEILHVIKGQIQVDIIENVEGKTRSIESIPVGIGQQLVLNDRVMQEYYSRKSPSVLGVLDPIFQTSDWYLWNTKQDENPTDFTKGSSTEVLIDSENTPDNTLAGTVLETGDAGVEKSSVKAPVLISPKSANIVLSKETQELSGGVAEGTKKLLLKQLVAGSDKVEKILINSLNTEKLTWSYLLSAQKGNLKPGKNVYEFVGIDENAKETLPLTIVIEYTAAESDLVNDRPALVKPTLSTVDGKPYKEGMVVDKDSFVLAGTANGSDQMWVDDFQLSKFKAGDSAWSYNVKTAFGNLKAGLNTYQIYGVSVDGKKSPILTVKINYKPANAPVVTTTTSTSPSATTKEPATSSTGTVAVPPATITPVVAPVAQPESPVKF